MEQGKSIQELEIGQRASFSKTITESDVVQYAGITGDFNPVHVNEEYAKNTMFNGRIAHGMLTLGFISSVLGTKLPGPGSIYVSQDIKFKAPVTINDTVTAICEVVEKDVDKNRVKIQTRCTNQKDQTLVDGHAVLMPPK